MVFWRKKKTFVDASELFDQLSPDARTFAEQCVAKFQEKKLAADVDYGLGGPFNPTPDSIQWKAEQETGEFFAQTSSGHVKAKLQALASHDQSTNTWEWGWNNPHVLDIVKQDAHRIKEHGEEKAIPLLTHGIIKMPKDPAASDKLSFAMLAMAVEITESETVFSGEMSPLSFHLGLKELERPGGVAEGEVDYVQTYYMDVMSCQAGKSLFERTPEVANILIESQPEFIARYKKFIATWGLEELSGWSTKNGSGVVRIDNPNGEVYADYQLIGSLDTSSSTWKWAWSDSDAKPELLLDVTHVKQFGEKHGISYLTEEQFHLDKDRVAEFVVGMMAISTKLNDAEAAFFPEEGSTRQCMALRNLRRTE